MTYDELLARLDLSNERFVPYEEFEKRNSALRAIVELHKPDEFGCTYCEEVAGTCLTIRIIEKELS